uniref:NADH-ubiquinone oxidoreductase chain 4 n=1 Tax=Tephrocybe rancida TaxID=117070 RepID=A0A386TYI6_9AGAR|nr:NADH dehydrogenase subunit 4 [Tephrocybe rancida]AYE93158.1 NADH dehydrogenase subunit 4 [Tephrocybe rancida]
MLTLLILIPILGVFCLLPIHSAPISFSPSYASSPSALSSVASVEARQESFGKIEEESNKKMKKIALTTSLINLFVSLFIWFEFDSSTTQFQFVSEFNQLNFCHLNFGIDGVSLFFVLLTTFVTPIALLSNYINLNKNLKLFLISLLLLESLQICAFVSLDLLLFYIFFESVLPLLFIVILIFGHGKDKVRSAQLLFLYTLAGSLPMLLCILGLFSYIGSTDFQLISLYGIKLDSQIWLWLGFFLAFAVKTPLFPFIIWLPKAHSDSPLAGSILLAATILKLATYGYFRVLINYFPDATYFLSPLIMTIGAISLIYASLTTVIQQDTKKLIAYSSVAHMSIVVFGLFSNNIQGIEGALLLAIGHGFVSPALFSCVGGVLVDRADTRVIYYLRGLALCMPVFTILFFVFTLANTGIPLTINFLGEQLSLIGIWQLNPVIAALGATGIVLSACYSLFLYNRVSYGSYSPHILPLKDLNRREYQLLISLLIPTVLFGIIPNVILNPLHVTSSALLYS